MDKWMNVLAVTLPVAAALLLGYLARRKSLVGGAAIDGFKALVMNFTLPAVLLGAFYTAELTGGFFVVAGSMFACCLLGLIAGALIHRFVPSTSDMLPFLTTGFEAGMMGYGLYAMLFPASDMHYYAMVDLGQVLFVFTLYNALLGSREGKPVGDTVRGMFTSPVFLAIALGLVLAATGLGPALEGSPVGAAFDALLGYIAAPTGMLMLFVVGYTLSFDKGSALAALKTLFIRLGIMAVLGALVLFVIGRFMPVPAPLMWAVILMFSLPAPFVLPIFSKDEAQSGYVASTLSLGALFSVAAFAVISILA